MSEEKKKVFVIKDEQGNYLSPRSFTLTNEGWLYSSFTGRATGFVYYTNQLLANEDMEVLQQIKNKYGIDGKFKIECVDLQSIKKGECIIKKIHSNKKLTNASK